MAPYLTYSTMHKNPRPSLAVASAIKIEIKINVKHTRNSIQHKNGGLVALILSYP